MCDKRLLAVQSHVVHGYVGNKAAIFPLQLKQWDVDALNAVQFSNHTGYGSFEGDKLNEHQIAGLYQGLRAQDFEYDALLTGYLPSASAVHAVHEIAADLRTRFPKLRWLLDPVMGDEGSLYVKQDVIPAYKSIFESQLVSITTPNHFEVELLTGITLDSNENVLRALDYFHSIYRVPHVVISSLPHPDCPEKLLTVGSSMGGKKFRIEIEKLDSYFTGTGDLFAALLLANFGELGDSQLAEATALTVTQVNKVLLRTFEHAKQFNVGKSVIKTKNMKFHELRLVQCADVYLANDISFKHEVID